MQGHLARPWPTRYVSEPALVVIDVAAIDDATVFAVHTAIAQSSCGVTGAGQVRARSNVARWTLTNACSRRLHSMRATMTSSSG
ncbi:DUF6207 family protein [Streptomyces olivochromogenes]|uniref:DUF6207 family protein n=1 Tax=Streptomyces olivochromogenes TaxID=1963 RepID=UPI001F33CE81|nr:DUF6207 family protein [Streptomyces olivochromogenes]